MEGTVKWFNRTKGYGFIQGEDSNEYFVHHTQVARGTFLRDNDRVAFEPADSDRGKQAQKVTLLQKGSEIVKEDAPSDEVEAESDDVEAEEQQESEEQQEE
ncbi:cold shock domain-containing protein [Candidatus Woesearchaeota archaeon]|nr:cold shock domain-containing protein [Candidatus Woesearchaeota archaeon]